MQLSSVRKVDEGRIRNRSVCSHNLLSCRYWLDRGGNPRPSPLIAISTFRQALGSKSAKPRRGWEGLKAFFRRQHSSQFLTNCTPSFVYRCYLFPNPYVPQVLSRFLHLALNIPTEPQKRTLLPGSKPRRSRCSFPTLG